MTKFPFFIGLIFLLVCLQTACLNNNLIKSDTPLLDQIQLPDGFEIAVYAASVKNARSMALGEQGTVFVGSRSAGNVYALVDEDGDFIADQQYLIASGLNLPNGVAFREGALYVAEPDKVWRYDQIESQLANPPQPVLVSDAFPGDAWHGWKYIAFGPDDKLYVPVGAPCNICEKEDPRYASIMRMNADGSGLESFAKGVRNTVGFSWHPKTQELWFTENGRDLLGDEVPNDELNRAPATGMHFGYPYCHAGDISDPRFGEKRSCDEFTIPVQKLAPHTAALGMKFYTGSMFPESYKHNIFIAEHGSWNRKEPIGYRIMRVQLEGNQVTSYEPFAAGWLQEGKAWGRPVDVLLLPDGSMLVSDDHADVVYRIRYEE